MPTFSKYSFLFFPRDETHYLTLMHLLMYSTTSSDEISNARFRAASNRFTRAMFRRNAALAGVGSASNSQAMLGSIGDALKDIDTMTKLVYKYLVLKRE